MNFELFDVFFVVLTSHAVYSTPNRLFQTYPDYGITVKYGRLSQTGDQSVRRALFCF